MKTLFSLFIVGVMAVLIFAGIAQVNEYMFLKGTLDEESQNLVLQYDVALAEAIVEWEETKGAIYQNGTNQLELDPDVNTVDSFVREYAESKAKVSIMTRSINIVTYIPGILLVSVPFLSEDDIKEYKEVMFYVILVIIGVAIINALFRREVAK